MHKLVTGSTCMCKQAQAALSLTLAGAGACKQPWLQQQGSCSWQHCKTYLVFIITLGACR